MKDGMLEVLIYLFENYIFEDMSFDPDHNELTEELEGAGFQSIEIDNAFNWLEGLLDACELDQIDQPIASANYNSIRFYNPREIDCIGVDGIGLLTHFVKVGVLTQLSREMVIDRVLALGEKKVDLDHIRWVVLLVLSNQPGFEEISEWAEVIVTSQMLPVMH